MDGRRTAKITLYLVIYYVLLIGFASCTPDDKQQKSFPVGIWRGTFLEKPISIEFHENGCAILVPGGGDDIGLARYFIDLEKQPGHLDLELITPPGRKFTNIIEKVNADTFRIQLNDTKPIRPPAFTSEAFLMHRSQEHVLPRDKSMEDCDEEFKQLSLKESIWFEGKDHNNLLDICEALFRYQFINNASGAQQEAAAYFLSIYGADPPRDLIARFENNAPPVKPSSVFQIGDGIKFEIRSFTRLDENNIKITGGYYEGGLSSSGNTYRLRRIEGVWTVINDMMEWIS
jgi:hypothetical protein